MTEPRSPGGARPDGRPLLVQIPWSHNCVKVRAALETKGIDYDIENVPPTDRRDVLEHSGQPLVPALVHGGKSISDSTAILLYLEEATPAHWPSAPRLLPDDPAQRAECLILEDWADEAFMAVTRRLAYAQIMSEPGRLSGMFFPGASGLNRRLKENLTKRLVSKRFGITPSRTERDIEMAGSKAALAVARLGGRRYLVGDRLSIADIALAAMTWPLGAAPAAVAERPEVAALLAWGAPILGDAPAGAISSPAESP